MDFGSSRKMVGELRCEKLQNEAKGTMEYCPPEFLTDSQTGGNLEESTLEESHYSSDYWSLVPLSLARVAYCFSYSSGTLHSTSGLQT